MAKQRTKLKDFFEGKRRRVRLQDFRVLKDEKDILRIKLSVKMPLSNQPADGMNDCFSDPYFLMAKEKGSLNYSKVNVAVDNATFHVFSTDSQQRPSVRAATSNLQTFRLTAEGVDEKREVSLEFNAELPVTDAEDDPLMNWAIKHLHADFFVEAVPSQMELETEPVDPKPNKKKKPEQANLLVN